MPAPRGALPAQPLSRRGPRPCRGPGASSSPPVLVLPAPPGPISRIIIPGRFAQEPRSPTLTALMARCREVGRVPSPSGLPTVPAHDFGLPRLEEGSAALSGRPGQSVARRAGPGQNPGPFPDTRRACSPPGRGLRDNVRYDRASTEGGKPKSSSPATLRVSWHFRLRLRERRTHGPHGTVRVHPVHRSIAST